MLFSILSDTYERLEGTSKKLKKTDIISELLKKTESKDIEKVVLLLNGSVFPAWSQQELGVANQIMIKALAKASGIPENQIVKNFKKTGDLGLTAEELIKEKKQKTLSSRQLTIENVFENLRQMALETGKKSQERKLSLITQLLTSAKPKEAKYIVRTVLAELRVGVAEGILRDAIAKAFNASPEEVENAWFLNPDYGEIAKIIEEKGKAGLKKVKIELGRPIIVLLAEKSPSLKQALEDAKNPALETKYDGARIVIEKKGNEFWLYTRRLENVTKQFPDLVELAKKAVKARDCVLDGECVGMNPKTGRPFPFQVLSQRIHRKYDIEKTIKQIPIQMNIFDIVFLNGKLLFDKPLKERRKILEKIINPIKGKFQLSEQVVTSDLKKADEFYKGVLARGEEGLIIKNLDALYQPGRRVAGGWFKVKPTLENLDLVIIGATWGTGKRAGWFSSFILGCRDPDTGKFLECGMMGTGIKEKIAEEGDITFEYMTKLLKPFIESEKGSEVKIKPKIVIEVASEEIQKSTNYPSGFALRFPRFIRIRTPEKGPEEADTLERVKALYEIQKGKKPTETEEK